MSFTTSLTPSFLSLSVSRPFYPFHCFYIHDYSGCVCGALSTSQQACDNWGVAFAFHRGKDTPLEEVVATSGNDHSSGSVSLLGKAPCSVLMITKTLHLLTVTRNRLPKVHNKCKTVQ